MNPRIVEKIRRRANGFYNLGLDLANRQNLSGARQELVKAVSYDKRHTNARNLLGLVCFQMGEIGEAVRHWTTSIALQPGPDNRAQRYLQDLKRNEKLVQSMNESLRLCNEAMVQLRKESPDYALVRLKKAVAMNRNYIKAYLLMALCYMETKNFRKAKATLDKVEKLDVNNAVVFSYRTAIREMQAEGQEDAGDNEIRDLTRDLYVQKTLATPDVQEIFTGKRNKRRSMRNWSGPVAQMLLFLAGIGCGVAAMFTLYVPDKVDSLNSQVSKLTAELTENMTARGTLESQLAQAQQEAHQAQQEKTELELKLEDANDEWQDKLSQQKENPLAAAMTAYLQEDYAACGKVLSEVEEGALEGDNKTLYTALLDKIKEPLYTNAFSAGYNAYREAQNLSGDSRTEKLTLALEQLTLAAEYSDAGTERRTDALYFLARTYYLQENWAEAVTSFDQYFEEYTGSTSTQQYQDAVKFSGRAKERAQG